MIAPRSRTKKRYALVSGRDPEAKYPVPIAANFEEASGDEKLDFLPAPDLERLARELIGHYPEKFAALTGFTVTYLWKREGGKSRGARRMGVCQKPSGLLKHTSEADFIIWLAADHCQGWHAHQVEALLFHELLHAGVSDKGKPILYPHDFEGFAAEIAEYGIWESGIDMIAQAIVQLQMFGGEED